MPGVRDALRAAQVQVDGIHAVLDVARRRQQGRRVIAAEVRDQGAVRCNRVELACAVG